MGITYTPNLHLGLQLNKTDYVNWDVITAKWETIDGISPSTSGGALRNMRKKLSQPTISGHTETFEPTAAMLSFRNEEQEER